MLKLMSWLLLITCSCCICGIYGWGAWALGIGMIVGSVVYILCDEK